jgi:hypothetical protein
VKQRTSRGLKQRWAYKIVERGWIGLPIRMRPEESLFYSADPNKPNF